MLVLIDPKGPILNVTEAQRCQRPTCLEFEAVVVKCKSEDELVERGMKVIADFDLSALLITRIREQGMTLLQPGKCHCIMPTQAQEARDDQRRRYG